MRNKNWIGSYWNWVNKPSRGIPISEFADVMRDANKAVAAAAEFTENYNARQKRVEEINQYRLQKVDPLQREAEHLERIKADPAMIAKKWEEVMEAYRNSPPLEIEQPNNISRIRGEIGGLTYYSLAILFRTLGTFLLYVLLFVIVLWLI
ncbi:MAG: hypothetical protein HY799_03870 [Nitrosomonadales bacterium]|nr:hypothetical protein [Nitrosomonadales bacterium]